MSFLSIIDEHEPDLSRIDSVSKGAKNSTIESTNFQINIDLKTFLSRKKAVKSDIRLNSILEKELLFLKKNSTVLSTAEKKSEIDVILREARFRKSSDFARSQFKNVKTKLLAQDRNPNVKNLLKRHQQFTNASTESRQAAGKPEKRV